MSLQIYDRLFKKSDKPNMIPSWNNASVKQWMVVSLMALILWVVSCQRGYCQIATTNPGEYTILATGNALINNTVKSETKAERETAVMQNAMAGEFTKMAEWERQYNSYLKMANGYASAIKAATHIYDDGVRILLTLNKLRQAATNNPQGIVATLDMNNLYMETVTEMVSVFTLLKNAVAKGGEKKGGSEAFFQNSAENFLAAIIYFFVNFHPTGYKNGRKLTRYVEYDGRKLKLVTRKWRDYKALDERGNVVLDFTDRESNNVSTDADGMFVDLNGFSYLDRNQKEIVITRSWYEDEDGNEVEPDTITGEYSDMPHVLSFLGRSYSEVFDILMQDPKIMSLMAPFQSAYKNKANDQLEGMVGTLRVNAARLVSPEAYRVFTGDDFDLKISDRISPSYLVIANDPEKEQVIGSLNAIILNRLVTRINSKGNLPVSIIVDELPTLYFHKIDRLIGTARSNKVAVTLGFQELPQLEADYGKNGMQKIITTCGNIFMGAARNKETLEWAQNDVFGKAKQTSKSITINDSKVSTSISEKMDNLVPAAKIADMATGWLAGQAARDFSPTEKKSFSSINLEDSPEFRTTKYFCKTNFNMDKIKKEEAAYVDLPKIYAFKDARQKEIMLNRNFARVNREIDEMIKSLLNSV